MLVVESLDDDDELSVDGAFDVDSEPGVTSTTVPFGDTVCGGIAVGLVVGTVVAVVAGGRYVGAVVGGGMVVAGGTVVVWIPGGAAVVVETGWVPG